MSWWISPKDLLWYSAVFHATDMTKLFTSVFSYHEFHWWLKAALVADISVSLQSMRVIPKMYLNHCIWRYL